MAWDPVARPLLSLSYALNEALKTNLTKVQAAQIAHNADIACKTGLGTVISEFTGGFELRLSVGGPGIGRVIKSELSTDWCVIVLCLEPIKTELWLDKSVTNENKHSLNLLGRKMVNDLHQDQNVDHFSRCLINLLVNIIWIRVNVKTH